MSGSLTDSPQYIVRQLLVDLGVAVTPDGSATSWPVYDGSEPDTPDNCITVYGTDPEIQGHNLTDGEVTEQYGFQVRVRSVTNETGGSKAREIAQALDKSVNLTVVTISPSSYVVVAVTRGSGPIPLGKEPSTKRYLHTINCKASIRQVT